MGRSGGASFETRALAGELLLWQTASDPRDSSHRQTAGRRYARRLDLAEHIESGDQQTETVAAVVVAVVEDQREVVADHLSQPAPICTVPLSDGAEDTRAPRSVWGISGVWKGLRLLPWPAVWAVCLETEKEDWLCQQWLRLACHNVSLEPRTERELPQNDAELSGGPFPNSTSAGRRAPAHVAAGLENGRRPSGWSKPARQRRNKEDVVSAARRAPGRPINQASDRG